MNQIPQTETVWMERPNAVQRFFQVYMVDVVVQSIILIIAILYQSKYIFWEYPVVLVTLVLSIGINIFIRSVWFRRAEKTNAQTFNQGLIFVMTVLLLHVAVPYLLGLLYAYFGFIMIVFTTPLYVVGIMRMTTSFWRLRREGMNLLSFTIRLFLLGWSLILPYLYVVYGEYILVDILGACLGDC